jgi:hypothetical protein
MQEEKKIQKKKINLKEEQKKEIKKKNFWGKIGNFVKEAVDCCIE